MEHCLNSQFSHADSRAFYFTIFYYFLLSEGPSSGEDVEAAASSPGRSPPRGQIQSPARNPLKSRSDSTFNSEEDVDGL